MENVKIPAHVGIIMDGNGRWAEKRGKKRSYGHHAGSDNVERVVEHAFKKGVKALTLYAFSSENWARPKEEVDELMKLLKTYFKKGGFAVHMNVLSAETLKKAQENPEKYKNLQVRLCGWNVYFADLSGEMQDNLIRSMEE